MNNSPQKFIVTNIIKQSPESESLGDCSFCPLTSPPDDSEHERIQGKTERKSVTSVISTPKGEKYQPTWMLFNKI